MACFLVGANHKSHKGGIDMPIVNSFQQLGEVVVVDRAAIQLDEEERRKQVWTALYWAEVERMGRETPHALWLKEQAKIRSHA
jgi:hypothetical protein